MSHAALVFGREDSGLTNEEVSVGWRSYWCADGSYPSLNLGQAVMVYCYQWQH
ncbi:hypothetical protein OHD50_10795 [Escherichia coli]|nr:hypothetical protein [Escherichia coli]